MSRTRPYSARQQTATSGSSKLVPHCVAGGQGFLLCPLRSRAACHQRRLDMIQEDRNSPSIAPTPVPKSIQKRLYPPTPAPPASGAPASGSEGALCSVSRRLHYPERLHRQPPQERRDLSLNCGVRSRTVREAFDQTPSKLGRAICHDAVLCTPGPTSRRAADAAA